MVFETVVLVLKFFSIGTKTKKNSPQIWEEFFRMKKLFKSLFGNYKPFHHLFIVGI